MVYRGTGEAGLVKNMWWYCRSCCELYDIYGTGVAGIEGYMWWYSRSCWELYDIYRYRCSRFRGIHVVIHQELLGTLWYIEVQVQQV